MKLGTRKPEVGKPRLGYIVVNEHFGGAPYELTRQADTDCWEDLPAAGILLHGLNVATVFRTKRAARNAIVATQLYHREHQSGADRYAAFPEDEVFCLVRLEGENA